MPGNETLTGTPGDDTNVVYSYSGPAPGTIDMEGGNDSVIITASPQAGLTISNTEQVTFSWDWQAVNPFGPITINGPTNVNLFWFAYATLLGNGWPGNISPFDYGLMRLEQAGNNVVLQVDYNGNGVFTNFITFTNTSVSALNPAAFFGNGWLANYPDSGWTLNGSDQGDTLYGTVGPDVINGGAGNDIISGGYGNDLLTGGAGADIFVFARNATHTDPGSRPVITDFNPAEDQIDLSQYGFRYFTDVLSRAYQSGNNVVIEVAPLERITLQNVQLSSLTASDFVGLQPGSSITALPPPEPLQATIKVQDIIQSSLDVAAGQTIFGYFPNGLIRGTELSPTLQITNEGTIWASGYSTNEALYLVDAYGNTQAANITNTGAIYAASDDHSMAIFGNLFTLDNSGVIASVAWDGSSTAVEAHWSDVDITNSGTISARGSINGLGTCYALELDNGLGYNGYLKNEATGQIVVEAPFATAVYLADLPSPGSGPHIVNQGLIEAVSDSDYASFGFDIIAGAGGYFDLLNTGTLQADIAVNIDSYPYDSRLTTTAQITNDTGGKIIGDLYFAENNDSFINRGTFTGNLYAGAGDDKVDTSAGQIVGHVDLGDGADTYIGGAYADDIAGGAGNDTLSGGGGDDIIDGGAGADAMDGGAGNDTYVVDDPGDTIVDASGIDTVYSSISYTLGPDLEYLALLGSAPLNGTGNALDNIIIGNDGANILSGGDGNDFLFGGAGSDVLTGGAGGDRFYFDADPSTGADQITDFSVGDSIYLDMSVFKALVAGVLDPSAFGQGATATTSAQHILYDSGTGNIYYDADGSGPTQPVLFATVAPGTQLNSWNFIAYSDPTNTVESAITTILPTGKLDLVLTGTAAIDGTGNVLDNVITGNSAANQLSGLDGSDQLWGGDGNDTLSGGAGNDLLKGEAGNDTLEGGPGNDLLDGGDGIDTASFASAPSAVAVNLTITGGQDTGGAGRDTLVNIENLTGSPFGDTLIGNDSDNVIVGGDGNDTLVGGRGNDTLDGGAGNDTVSYAGFAPVVVSLAIAGPQQISPSTYPLDMHTLVSIENLIGSDWADNLTGDDGANSLVGGAGNDVLSGAGGNDALQGDDGNDQIHGGSGDDILAGGIGDDQLFGDDGNDNLVGGDGNDVLDGGAGADTMAGGMGDDIYYVDNSADVVIENAGEGADSVHATIDYTLGANVESLSLDGSAAINGTGNSLDNGLGGNDAANTLSGLAGNDYLISHGGNDILDGGTGADTMLGGTGDDTYIVDNVGDVVVENPGEGTDTVRASISYTLPDNVENLTLAGNAAINGTGNGLDNVITGNSATNVLTGGAGNDTLIGGASADHMYGGAGDDTYYVDSAGDSIGENPGEGTDTVYSTASSYTLSANVENLILTGTAAINGTGSADDNTLTGNDAANYLSGRAGNDTLIGNGGNDHLDGGTGADTMIGGLGNDIYYVDNAGDVVTENPGEGTDTVVSTIAYTLPDNVENLNLSGAGTVVGLNGTGNALDNFIQGTNGDNVLTGLGGNDTLYGKGGNDTLIGGDGNDRLDGGVGADTMIGGLGNDTYIVDNVGDVVTENPGEGTDSVQASISYTLPSNVEYLTLLGSSAINGAGNELNNLLVGNSGDNILSGMDGNDTIKGGAGNDTIDGGNGDDIITGGTGQDTMTGGAGHDTFVFTNINESLVGSADLITDFYSSAGAGASDDKLDLSAIDADTTTAGDQAFTWDQFTPTAHGIWIGGVNADGSVTLYGDVNGDTTPDFEIHIILANNQLNVDDIVF